MDYSRFENPVVAAKGDLFRISGAYSFRNLVVNLVSNRLFRVIFMMRVCQWLYISSPRRLLLPIARLFFKCLSIRSGIDLSWNTAIGEGLAITHGWGLVVSRGAKIGRNVTLFHGVTIGRRDQLIDGTRVSGYPTIEDDVWIGPHAIVVGQVKIGKGSKIAGGSFVISDIPPYSVVMGNPASVCRTNAIPDVMNPVPMTDSLCSS